MKTKNLTPFPFGTKVTSRNPPALEMTAVVRGRFRLRPGEALSPLKGALEQGPLTADVFAEGDDDRTGECLYASDFADFKVRTDLLLKGTCHAPGNRLVPECPVTFSVGSFSKTLRVVGRRVWTEQILGQPISSPAPFVTMPLGYTRAFGGPELATNPVGQGLGTAELPNVEQPDTPVRSRASRPEPAGFGPINPAWPPRNGKLGKEYGESYRKKRAPFYAEDFDWTHFNAAPEDQQLERALRGDEALSFQNLHPAAASFSTALPGIRVRVFVKDREGKFAEVPMRLDTLFADLDEEHLTLTWRGLTPVAEDDLTDVKTALVASEPLADKPLSADHYRALLEAFEADPLEIDQRVPKEAKAMLDAAPKGEPPRSPLDFVESMLGARVAAMSPEVQSAFAASMKQARADAAKAKPANDAAPPTAAVEAQTAGAVDRLGKQLDELKKKAKTPQQVKQVEEMQTLLASAEVAPRMKAPSTQAPLPGADLSGRDFSRQDLSGIDLTSANLSGARLSFTKLRGARLVGVNLGRADLLGADLSDADLTGADLTQAVLVEARAVGAIFAEARLDRAILDKADLTFADLRGARGEQVLFGAATLREVKAAGIDLYKAIAGKIDLEGADFSRAKLVLCLFLEARAKGLRLTGALLEKTSFAGADLQKADVSEARGTGSVWNGATLDEADFRYSKLPDAHFMQASARGTKFSTASLRGGNFYRSILARAELVKADVLGANFNKSDLRDAKFTGANLYDAKMLGASGERCDFTGANLKRVMFDPR
jgi:uncharacterized protein YjbI with pentapeptide repeats